MIDWKTIAVSSTDTIRKAMIIIDSGALKFAVVTDANNTLLGTITDGDIRRALIAGANMEDIITSVYNPKPYSINKNTGLSNIKKYLVENGLTVVPIVDGDKIVGLHTLQSLLIAQKKENPVFIMAGGFGTRLKPLTDNTPKPMLEVGGVPMLERLIKQFKNDGFYKFFISTHYLPEVIQSYFGDGESLGVQIEYVFEENPLGTGGALGLLPKHKINLPLIMINGDVLTKLSFKGLLEKHQQSKCIATMCVREYEYKLPYGVVDSANQLVVGFVEKPTYKFLVNAGIYVIEPALLEMLPRNTKIDMPTLLENNLEHGIYSSVFHDYWLDIGKMEDFKRAQSDIKEVGFD
ncbi:nucleotidyltransferase family protein [Vibrio chagasii]|uniref:nucleotidyltransferase family protein n=1 Tax=Vibrio chagasii TaxID=170679 RepID=UPI002283F389|nr:nucleotidyltransferase family protein [Vibrio chagasii]MCY9826427.1 nucleotidyltransferase family protein [Vibrio chagasii]